MNFKVILVILALSLSGPSLFSQDLMNLLGDDKPTTDYTYATFKTTHLVIGQSVESPSGGDLMFTISHHFGSISSGVENFFGLDMASMRLGFEYGITDRLSVGIGRSTYEKTVDGNLKYKILRQSKGARIMPFTLSFYSDMSVKTAPYPDPNRTNYFSSKLAYSFQFLLARKFNDYLSFQLMPSMVHKNLVPSKADPNDIFVIGAGGRCKITKRLSINAEYYFNLDKKTLQDFNNSASIGFDIETGGHVFQIFLTNSNGLFEKAFLTESQGSIMDGVMFIGFNLNRIFTIFPPKIPQD